MIIVWKRNNRSQSGSIFGGPANVFNWITSNNVVGVRLFCTRVKAASLMRIKAITSEPFKIDLNAGTPQKIGLWVGDPELLVGGNPNE